MTATPESYMRRALDLARRAEGRTRPNPPVGAVVVQEGKIVGEGFHEAAGKAHAEIIALQSAGDLARGADLYVTLEPCSHYGRTGPCADAVIEAGVKRVVAGMCDPNPRVCGIGLEKLRQAGIVVQSGILEKDCRFLIAPFAKHVRSGLPFVTLKTAVTLDGRTATSTGDSQWISNESSREKVHRLRDRVDAIMAGSGTVLRDNPHLTTRLPEGGRDPVRILIDGMLRIPEDAHVLDTSSGTRVLIAAAQDAPHEKKKRLRDRGVEILELPEREGKVSLPDLMRTLGKMEIQHILLEGGAELNAALLREELIDRFMIFVAPLLIGGGDGKGIFSGKGAERLSDAVRLEDIRISRFGNDTLIEGELGDVYRTD